MTDNKLEKIKKIQENIHKIKELLQSDIRYVSYHKPIDFIELLGSTLNGKRYGCESATMDIDKEMSDAIKDSLKKLLNKLEEEYEKY